MKTPLLIALVASTLFGTSAASADDKAACVSAASKAQRLRDTHKLVEARAELRVCASAQCPGVVQSDCVNWLAEVEKAIPTVVVAAKSATGGDLIDVKVMVDGEPLLSKIDGQAVPINAGPHTFHFETADGTALDRQILVKEGEKNQSVVAALQVKGVATPEKPASHGGTLRTVVGPIVGGVGILGLGVGAAYGFIASSDKSKHCVGSDCDTGAASRITSESHVSTIALVAGGVLAATGLGFMIFAPKATSEPTTTVSLQLSPLVAPNAGGALLLGRF